MQAKQHLWLLPNKVITLKKENRTLSTKIKNWFVEPDDMPKSMRQGKGRFVFCMVIISLLHFLVFYIGTNYKSIVLAFQAVDYIDENGLVHYKYTLDNFRRFFEEMKLSDTLLPKAFKNTLMYFVLDSLILFPIGIFTSYFLYKKIRGHQTLRVLFYLPSIISSVVVVATFTAMTSLGGPVHQLAYDWFGVELPSFYSNENTTKTIMLYLIWCGGLVGNFILITGTMSRIPKELLESAQLDGVGIFREFFQIVIPLIWDTVGVLFIMSFVGIFSASGPILLFNAGEDHWTISYWIFKQVTSGSYSYPAAVGLLLTIVSFPIVMLVRWLINRVEGVEY